MYDIQRNSRWKKKQQKGAKEDMMEKKGAG